MKIFHVGDPVFLINEIGNKKLAEGTVCEVGQEDGVTVYYLNRTDIKADDANRYGPFRAERLLDPKDYPELLDNQPLMLQTITATRCSDGMIWVTSDLDPNGMEFQFDTVTAEKDEKQFLCAVAEFLGFDPDKVIHFEED